jgi:hypothetical protein
MSPGRTSAYEVTLDGNLSVAGYNEDISAWVKVAAKGVA